MKNVHCCRFIAALILLCVLSGCSSGPKGVGAVLSAKSHKLTQEQMLTDYDAMWNDIEENYPLMGVAERTTGKDFVKVKADYREKVTAAKSDEAFYELLTTCIDKFGGCGHICIFNKDGYAMRMSTYKKLNYPQCKYLYRAMNNPASKTFYSYTPTDIYEKASKEASENGGSGNISTIIMEKNKIALLKIKSFRSQYVTVDGPAIADFFTQINSYENCIIDIRGNGGGDTNYWFENIVTPNIDSDVTLTSYELVKGETAKKYLSKVQKLRPISEFKKLPNFNEKDLAQMKYFMEDENVWKSKTGKKVFSGKFYLLTDEKVYSSSEAFASFCKESGFAKIVGERTGGDGVGIDPIVFVLPNSGICLRFSASQGLNSDGGSSEEFGTQPDFPCAQGKDALDTCIDIIQQGK